MVVAVVLAAGAATRFGATKQLVEVGGQPLVAHAVAAAYAGGVDDVVVVVGHDADAVAHAAASRHPATVVNNPAYADGQASSLAAGVSAADRLGADAVVILLADQPAVTPASIRLVLAAVRGGAAAARARYDDGPGHPVAFARPLFGRLTAITGDRGARDLLADLAPAEVRVAGPAPPDVDTPADLPTT